MSAGLRAGKYSTTGLGARALQIFGGPGRRPVRARSVHVTTRSGRASHLHETAPHALPGRCGVRSGAGGHRRLGGFPEPPAEAARVSSTPHVVCAHPSTSIAPGITDPARALSRSLLDTTCPGLEVPPSDFPAPPLAAPPPAEIDPRRTRDSASSHGFKWEGGRAAEPSMPVDRHPSEPQHPSRGAVTRQGAALAASPSEAERASSRNLILLRRERSRSIDEGLTAPTTHNFISSAGRVAHLQAPGLHTPTGPALLADLSASVAVSARTAAVAPGTADYTSSLAVPNLAAVSARRDSQARLGLIEQFRSTKADRDVPVGVTQGERD